MADIITLKINVSLLQKERFFKGAKGTYCDLVLIPTPDGQYGDYMVKQSVTKEERATKVEMPILGNGKIFQSNRPPQNANGRRAKAQQKAEPIAGDGPVEDDSVPF